MFSPRKGYWEATFTLAGAIIGVGIFGVAYAFSKVGWAVALAYIGVLTIVQLMQHLMHAEAGVACDKPLRFIGLSTRYLGPKSKGIASAAVILGLWAALLAYVVVGGTFLHVLLSPYLGGEVMVYQLAWGAVSALTLYFSPKVVAEIDVVATGLLLVALLVVVGISVPHVQAASFVSYTGSDLFLPYGVVLFSLSGLPIVLELEDMVDGDRGTYRASVISGTLIAAAVTALLGFVVWGVTGEGTTPDAVTGLRSVIGARVAVAAAAFGFFAVATSYIGTAMSLKGVFSHDFNLPNSVSWVLTVGVPFVAFLVGANSFVSIISFSGAVFGGISAVIVGLTYRNIVKNKVVTDDPLGLPLVFTYLAIAMFAVGATVEVTTVIMGWLA